MNDERRSWKRWWVPVSLALVSLLLLVGVLQGRSAARQTAPPLSRGEQADPPSAEQEALWAAMGLNDAWYVANGYTESPPPSAPSPFWSGSEESAEPAEVLGTTISEIPRLIIDPQSVAIHAYADQPKLLTATVSIDNGGAGTLDWLAELTPGGTFTPTLVPTSGLEGEALTLMVDGSLYAQGALGITYTRWITISATPSHTLDSPQVLTASLYVDPHPPRLWLDKNEVVFHAGALSPGIFTRTVEIRNTGGYTMTWQTEVVDLGVAPTVTPTTGVQDGFITITVDSRGYPTTTAVYTGQVVVSATWDKADVYPVLDNPQEILVRLQTALYSAHLPHLVKQPTPTPIPTPTPTPTPTRPPDLPEVRAIWVTRYDWTSANGPEGPEDIDRIVANVAGAGFNTIFFQVRAHGDAYYTPGLEPWSARLNNDGVLGQYPGWDPLARMIEQAHARGIRVHAYVNVFPTWLGKAAPAQGTTPLHPFWAWSAAYGWANWRHWEWPGEWPDDVMNLNDSYLWASPGVDGVRDHVVAVTRDIVSRYGVDGVHLDLVRYANSPYSYDPSSNAAAGPAKTPARDQWQRDRVTGLVSRVYSAIKEIRPGARLSAAVWFCYYADGCGYGLSSGYADFYQDSLGWLEAGVIDGIAPMLYGWSGFQNLGTWRTVMQQFQARNAGRHVYPGIDGGFYSFSEIANRIQAARDAGAAGHAIFSYGKVDERGYWDDFASGPYAQPATLAPLSWTD